MAREAYKIIELENFTKSYSRRKYNPIVKNANLVVNKGEFHAFIGPNGSGKTTIIKSIIGAFKYYSGKIIIDNKDIKNSVTSGKIGYIPEKSLFPKGMSCLEYLIQMSMLNDISRSQAKQKSMEIISDLNLNHICKKDPNNFSSGQKQLILLAQALLSDPDILIMDEPVANLDPKVRNDFFEKLVELNKKGKTIFISSHILAELNNFVDSLTIIKNGEILYSGPINSLDLKEKIYLKTNNNVKTIEYFKTRKIAFTLEKQHFLISNKLNQNKIVMDLNANGIEIEEIRKQKNDLWNIYKNILEGNN